MSSGDCVSALKCAWGASGGAFGEPLGEPPGSLRGSLWGAGDWPPIVNEKAPCFEDGWKLLWNPVGWCKNMWDVAPLKGFGGRWTPDIDCPDQDPAAADLRDEDPGDSDPTEEDPGDEDPSDEDTTDEGPAGPAASRSF